MFYDVLCLCGESENWGSPCFAAIKKDEQGEDLIYISFDSPIGKAIHGKKAWTIVKVKNEENSELKILEIE